LKLTDEEQRMLNGEHGPGVQRAMDFLYQLGEGLEAERMIKVTSTHILPDMPTELLEQFTINVAETPVTVSLMPCFDPIFWREHYGIVSEEKLIGGVGITDEKDYAKNLTILKRLKALPVFTCTPYTVGIVPRRNDVCVWSGTSGQNAANSMFGARAPRQSLTTSLASSIAGVVPYEGLLKPENRFAHLQINTDELDIATFTFSDFGALGYFIGKVARTRNVVFNGLPGNLSIEQCKYLTSPLTVDGACTMCHIVGVTPEAPTLEIALGGKKPEEIIKVTRKDIDDVRSLFTRISSSEVKLVVFGCPHLSILELRKLASLLDGRKLKEGKNLMVGLSRMTFVLAKEAGFIDPIAKAGAIITDCCVSGQNPLVHIKGIDAVATNSARAARFFQTQTAGRCRTYYGEMDECTDLVLN
jgi:cis-L-3-hydroxyproline dehydratase